MIIIIGIVMINKMNNMLKWNNEKWHYPNRKIAKLQYHKKWQDIRIGILNTEHLGLKEKRYRKILILCFFLAHLEILYKERKKSRDVEKEEI